MDWKLNGFFNEMQYKQQFIYRFENQTCTSIIKGSQITIVLIICLQIIYMQHQWQMAPSWLALTTCADDIAYVQ